MDMEAAFDQYGAYLEQLARIASEYYNALVAEGIPEVLAYALVQDHQRIWLESQWKQINKD